MQVASLPKNEAARLAELRSYEILDTGSEETFDDLADLARQIADTPIGLVTLVDDARQWFKSHLGLAARETPRELAFCAHAILGTDIMEVPNAPEDPRFADNPLVTGDPYIRFYAGIPLVSPRGFALGTLCVIDRQPRKLTPLQREGLEKLAHALVTTLELHRAYRTMVRLAFNDPLTGLLNRAGVFDALQTAIAWQRRYRGGLSVIYMDLDHFKTVNDIEGHAAGDRALVLIATAIRAVLRENEIAGRIGGDEFVVILRDAEDAVVAALCEQLRGSVSETMSRQGWPVTVSMGAATFSTAPESPETALARADQIMYQAKGLGKDAICCQRY
jgi:diguanylate cyclase (GGDEF)-like protein